MTEIGKQRVVATALQRGPRKNVLRVVAGRLRAKRRWRHTRRPGKFPARRKERSEAPAEEAGAKPSNTSRAYLRPPPRRFTRRPEALCRRSRQRIMQRDRVNTTHILSEAGALEKGRFVGHRHLDACSGARAAEPAWQAMCRFSAERTANRSAWKTERTCFEKSPPGRSSRPVLCLAVGACSRAPFAR